MPVKAFRCQKCSARLCSLTQTGIFETTMVLASKSRNQGVIKRPALPQNQGPYLMTLSRSSSVLNLTMKKPLGHRYISHLDDQDVKTH